MKRQNRSGTRLALALLRRLMAGEALTVSDAVAGTSFSDDATRRCLLILEHEIPGVVSEGGWRRRWRYRPPDAEESDGFTVLSLLLARTMISAVRGSELDARIAEQVKAALQTLPASHVVPDVARVFYAKSGMIRPRRQQPEIVDRLAEAILEQRRIGAAYQHFEGDPDRVLLEPYTILFADGGLYLYARCVDGTKEDHIDRRRLYSIDRLATVRKTKQAFVYPTRDEYDPEQVFQHCFGFFLPPDLDAEPTEVALAFSPRWQHFLKRRIWHASQSEPVERSDGWWEVRFRIYITPDFVMWVRGHGRELRVIRPESLRSEVAR